MQSASGAASFLFKVNVVNGASAGSVFRIHASPDSLSGLAGAVRVNLGLEPADAANDQASDVSGPAGVTSGLVLRYDDEVRETGRRGRHTTRCEGRGGSSQSRRFVPSSTGSPSPQTTYHRQPIPSLTLAPLCVAAG